MKSIGKSILILLALIVGAYFLASVFNLLPEPSPQTKKKHTNAANEPLIDDDYWVEKGTQSIGYVVHKGEHGAKGLSKTVGNLGVSDAKRSVFYLMPFALILAIIFIFMLFFKIKRLQGVMGNITGGIAGLSGSMKQVAESANQVVGHATQVAGQAGAMAGASSAVEGDAYKASMFVRNGTLIIALLISLLFLFLLLLRGGIIQNMSTAMNEPYNNKYKHQPNSLPNDQESEILEEKEEPLDEDALYLDSDYTDNRQLYDYRLDNYIYQVQLGRFLDEPADLALYQNLKHLGNIESETTHDDAKSERVTLGSFYTRPTADSILHLVRESGFEDAFVIMKDVPQTFGQYNEGTNQALTEGTMGQAIRIGVFQKPPYHTLSSLNDLGYMLFPPRTDGLVEVYLTANEFNDMGHLNQVLQAVKTRGFEDAFVTPLKSDYYVAKQRKPQVELAGYALNTAKKDATVEYMIQLEASEKPNITDYQPISKYGNLYTEEDNNRSFIRVLLGPYFKEDQAYQMAKKVEKEGVTGAFIQRYHNTPKDNMRRKYRDLIYVQKK